MKKTMADYRETIRRIYDGDFDDATPQERAEAVADVIQMCSAAAAAVTVQPVPLIDTILISPIQITMVQAIGRIYGHRLDKQAILEMLSTFGASIIAQNAIIAAGKLLPFIGWVLSIAMAFALTYAIGEASDLYFSSGRTASVEELRGHFSRVYETKKEEWTTRIKTDRSLKAKLDQLVEARKAGVITDEEFEEKKKEILANF
jgi:uncharacterized protein (DUF697 family)